MKQWLVRRGVIAALPVVSLVLAFGACSSESGSPGGQEPSQTSASEGVPPVDGVALETKPLAVERFERLAKQFRRIPIEPPEPPAFKPPPGVLPPRPVAARPPLAVLPVIRKGDAKAFVRQGERFRAQVDPYLKEKTPLPASVDLPATADGFVRVQSDQSDVGVEFATQEAREGSAIEVAEGTASFPAGAPGGGDLLYRVTADGVEDYVVLEHQPARARVDYRVKVGEVSALRLYDNVLEFLNREGEPQIRVKPPRVIDADGVMHEAFVSLSGCQFDTSPQPPLGRELVAPGADECRMSVTWDDTGVTYPAVVDPVWATAGSLAIARYRAAAVRLASGSVMTCGGIGDLGIAIKSCEVYTPSSGAGSWTTGPAMGTARSDHTLFLLSPASTDILAVGGNGVYTSERITSSLTTWSASTGDFSAVTGCPSCNPYFNPQMPAMTSDGAYVVLVDYQGAPYRYTTSSNSWSNGTANPSPQQQYRYDVMILQVPGQATILRLGGYYSSSTFSSGERYKPSTDSWSSPGNSASMTVPRSGAATAILDASHLMVYGGYTGAAYSSTAEIYNATANTWGFTTGPLPNGYSASQYNRGITWAFHGSGKMLSNTDQGLYLYDPSAASSPWSVLGTTDFSSLGSQANIVTAGSRVLMVPVYPSGGTSGPQTACRLFDFGDKGSQCTATAECQAGLTCAKDNQYDYLGVCCDTGCTGACSSCQAAHKTSGTGDGTCGPRKSNEYVGDTACPYTDPTTCGTSGYYCDGAGSCAKWGAGTQCGDQSCADGDTQNNARTCDGNGTCQQQTTTDCSAGYQCNYGYCQTSCYNQTDYCTSNYYCQDFTNPYYTCQPKKSNGGTCNYAIECTSGNCVDGVCCDKACNGTCEACIKASTGVANGTCKFVTAGIDPDSECADNGAGSCGQNGYCNGAGACQKYAQNTVCQAASCASATTRNIPDLCNGTGLCVDSGTETCATGYACLTGVCQTSCTDDSQCASDYYCDSATHQCVADKTQGKACPRDAACQGNANCVDGVCCDSACTGTCRSCLKARTGLAADGTCGNILDDTDPENECTQGAGYPQSCQAPGLCNGQGACRAYAKVGVECDTDVCTDSTLTTYACNGAGTCKPKSTQCYPFKCDESNNVCKVACGADADCVDGSFCSNGTCLGQLAQGSACTNDGQCESKHCANIGVGALQDAGGADTGAGGAGAGGAASTGEADTRGVCCDQDCKGTCSGCKASIKGFGSDGVCEFVKNNTDPADNCQADPNDACGLDGQCNGAGACRLAPSGTACGNTKCQGNSVLGQSCNGQGDCINNQGGIDCAPYVCHDVQGAFQCTNPCSDDNDCQDGYFCADAKCSKKLPNGKACDSNGICGSGYCVDGVCCDASCNGQCEACDVPGSEGTCSPVQGDPHGTRPECDHAGEECGGQCDGVNAAACKYAANGTACGDTTCDAGIAKSSVCNGQGECRANKDTECSPYQCGSDDTCLTRCAKDEDCSQGYACDETTQRCLPSAVAATCSDDRLTSVGQNGQSTPCKPFLCVPSSGSCAVSCAFTTDCAPEFVCEPSTKTCLPAPTDTGAGQDQSCACRAAGGAPAKSGYWALAALGLALSGLRRRRSGKRPHLRTKPRRFNVDSHPSE